MEVKGIIEALNYYFSNTFKDKGVFLHKITFGDTKVGAYKKAQLEIYYKELKKKAVLVDTLNLAGKVINGDKGPLTEDVCKAFIVWLILNKDKIDSYGV
jgi:hypothetical protein